MSFKRRSLTSALAAVVSVPLSAQAPDSVWTIRGGTFSGATVRVDAYLAKRSKFLRQSKLRSDPRLVTWTPSRLPAPVAFRPGKVTPEDSVAFWSILGEMERDMGMRLFEPATVTRDADPDDVIVVDLRSMSSDEGVTYVTWSNNGGLYDARVYLRSRATLHDERTVTHEMMHALGFGHTAAWVSIMNSGQSAPRRLTPADVAYAQFAFDSRAATDRGDMWQRLALAVERDPDANAAPERYAVCDDWSAPVIGRQQWVPAVLPIAGPLRSSSCFR